MFAYAKPEQKQVAKNTVQKKETENKSAPNLTGIPDEMKTNFENYSGFSFSDVRVHYNSDKPAQLQALAYTQGNQVYVAPGQEKHLGHELGHVVQQKEGRVQPTMRLQSVAVNDDDALEHEADTMGEAVQMMRINEAVLKKGIASQLMATDGVVQRCEEGYEALGAGYVQTIPSDKCPSFIFDDKKYHVSFDFGFDLFTGANWNQNAHLTCDGSGGTHYFFYRDKDTIKDVHLPPSANKHDKKKKDAEKKQQSIGDIKGGAGEYFKANYKRIIGLI